jgi:hypothetical protein
MPAAITMILSFSPPLPSRLAPYGFIHQIVPYQSTPFLVQTRNPRPAPKKHLLEKASEVFEKGKKSSLEPDVKELHAKIGRLTMENDFLAVALGRIDGSSAKK